MDSISVSIEDDNSSNLIDGFWLKVFYDVVPPFCSSCLHLGHSLDACKIRSSTVMDVNSISEQRLGMARNAAQVFEELPEPALQKNSAPSSSSAGYSDNHGNKGAQSQVWVEIKSARLAKKQNTSNTIQNLIAENCFDALKFPVADLDENIQGAVAEIDTNIAKADLSSIDPARSNSVLLQIASEDKKGLDPTTQVDCSIDSVPPCLLDKSPVVESQKIVTTGIPSGGQSTETTVNLQLICDKTVKKAEVKGGEQHKAKTGKKIELPVAASAQAVKQKQIEDVQDLHNSQSLSSQHLRAEDTSDKGKELRLENSFGSLVLPGSENLGAANSEAILVQDANVELV
ncbi:hypothetical protein Leryth_017601 [Lithospermum erythrorhizon]|nr:hypothetical protein Leryth_017601 [Lithospermum erythrorhizon]